MRGYAVLQISHSNVFQKYDEKFVDSLDWRLTSSHDLRHSKWMQSTVPAHLQHWSNGFSSVALAIQQKRHFI